MKRLSILLIILLIFIPCISYSDYLIDISNNIVVDGWIKDTVITAHESKVDYIYEEDVINALDEVGFKFNGDFTVYIIDYSTYNKDVLGLALPNSTIVLFDYIPHRLERLVHYTVVHELGHLVYMNMTEWQQEYYKILRGIPNEWDNYPQTAYVNRPQEIFAEDFRILFGGEDASMYIHFNQELDNPKNIKGLENFIRQFEEKVITQ